MPIPAGGGGLKKSAFRTEPVPVVPMTESISRTNVFVATGPVTTSRMPLSTAPPGSNV
jgi:hypothetical protein